MFSGIVESQSRVLDARAERGLIFIEIARPDSFLDISVGDSVCCDGVCLTVDSFVPTSLTFALGAETLAVTGWTVKNLNGRSVNLERSLRVSDRVHGHMVSGHVDGTGEITKLVDLGGSVQFDLVVSTELARYAWKKGSWAVNGVSLTINSIETSGVLSIISHCLIPETLRRTNLGSCKLGDKVNLEVDMMARGLVQFLDDAFASGKFANSFSTSNPA